MTPLGRLVRRSLERLLGRWREGPETPGRVLRSPDEFLAAWPGATAEEWRDFAMVLADAAYRDGYLRGWEWAQRADKPWHPPPDEVADAEDPGWRADSPPVSIRPDGSA